MTKRAKSQLFSQVITSICLLSELGVALLCATSGWLPIYAICSIFFTLAVPMDGQDLC